MKKMFIFLLLGWIHLQASYVWQSPIFLAQEGSFQTIALDPSGNAIAVWKAQVSGHSVVQAATKLFGQPWSAPEVISNPSVDIDGPVLVRVDAQGNGIVVWVEPFSQLNSAVKLFGQPWSGPSPVPTSANVEDFDLAMDPNGNSTVVFDTSRSGGTNQIWSSERTLLGPWGASVQISDIATIDDYPFVGVDSSGNVTASWGDSTNNNIMVATKPFGMGWQLPGQAIITGASIAFPAALVSVNPRGDVIVLALNNNGAITAFKPFNQAWQAAQQIPGSMNAIVSNAFPGIGLDNQGNAIAVWYDTNGALSLSTQLFGQAWSSGQTFSSPAPPPLASFGIPSITIDPCGLVLFSWNGNGIQVSSGPIGGVFSSPVTIEGSNQGQAPLTVQNPCNHAMVTWLGSEGNPISIQVAEGFVVSEVNSFSGSQQTINFGTEKSFTNHLVWTKSLTVGVAGYRIYRNGSLIATVGPTTFQYDDIQQTRTPSTQYSITVIDENGTETTATTINVP